MAQAEVFSPAKINLFLAVTGKRNDGFHSLLSVVAQLDFGDRLKIDISEGKREVSMTCSDSNLPTGEGNLVYRAAALYLDRFDLERKVVIDLDKVIPIGAGLGGGSSNAAVVLRALNDELSCCDSDTLSNLAAEIGSDCPLFLNSKPLIMSGRGEILDDLPQAVLKSLRGRQVFVFKPNFSISTPWAYGQLAKGGCHYFDAEVAADRLKSYLDSDGVDLEGLLYNSFEEPIFAKIVGLRVLRDLIDEQFGLRMLMSGSGSSCFVLCDLEQVDGLRKLVTDCFGEEAFARASSIID